MTAGLDGVLRHGRPLHRANVIGVSAVGPAATPTHRTPPAGALGGVLTP
ncbi:hypothetical protein SNL152K_1925 [Streptomyces sp. NL15-2K]|nr:hypothetical protein SNL152K_1925 [Streptomyces sp. NL15-2K]